MKADEFTTIDEGKLFAPGNAVTKTETFKRTQTN